MPPTRETPPARDPPVLTAPPVLVASRLLTAESCAAAALALAQCPAVWAAVATVALMQEAAAEYEATELGNALADLLAGAMTTPADTATAIVLLESVDHAARAWAMLAHPGARLGTTQPVPVLGIVS